MHLIRLDPDRIVDGVSEPLLAAQVPLGGLHANVPEQELNLLQFATGFMTQASACAAEVVRSNISEPRTVTRCPQIGSTVPGEKVPLGHYGSSWRISPDKSA